MEVIETYHLARVLTTEAGPCALPALILVAHTFTRRNSAMHATKPPSRRAVAVALLLDYFPDFWPARFVFSREDMQQRRVQDLVAGRGPPFVLACREFELHIYR